MLIDRSSFSIHLPWMAATAVLAALATGAVFLARANTSTWPGGSSLPGFTFGVIGGLICVFEFLLWPRKKLRAWRIGRTQIWMRAHIWLGLLAVPVLIFHSGFRWGGTLSTVVMILFLVVVASGIWGLIVQQFLPKRMLRDLPAETITSQIPHVSALMAQEAERLVLATCGVEGGADPAAAEELGDAGLTHMVVGKVRVEEGGLRGIVLETRGPAQQIAHAEALAPAFSDTIRPYLEQGGRAGSILRTAPNAAEFFRKLRKQINPAAHPVVDHLAELCDQRRQFDEQERLQFWLHNWLLVHLPLSAALIVLMFVHVFVAIKYW